MELTGFGGKLNVREFGRVAQWPDPARREFLETFPDAIRMAAGQQSKTLPGILLRSCGMPSAIYTVECMMERWQIEIEPEVRDWLELLPFRLYRRVEDKTDRLLDEPTTLGEPYSRHLGGKLRELRLELDGEAVRIPYWLAPGQRIVLLTVFRKTRMRETAEVERAHHAQKVCEAEHGHAQYVYERRKES